MVGEAMGRTGQMRLALEVHSLGGLPDRHCIAGKQLAISYDGESRCGIVGGWGSGGWSELSSRGE